MMDETIEVAVAKMKKLSDFFGGQPILNVCVQLIERGWIKLMKLFSFIFCGKLPALPVAH